jgi:hypothetical protein
MFFATRVLVLAALALLPATAARAETWTGLAAPDNNWTTIANWDTTVPVSGSTAVFSSAGNGNTAISLGGTTQQVGNLWFDTANAAAYTIGQLAGDALAFDAGGEIRVFDTVTNPQTINATALIPDGGLLATNYVPNGVTTGNGLVGLTFGPVQIGNGIFYATNAVANTTTALNGTIADAPGKSGTLQLYAPTAGAANNSNFIITGNNTYTGGTIVQANSGTNGAVYIGSDTAFSTGKVTTVLVGNSVEFRALGGTRTLANAFDLKGGINFAGTDSFVITGTIAIADGTSRTLQSKITGGGTLTLGATPGSSIIYLGNPTSNGGDGAGRTIVLTAASGATTIVNALFQDVDATNASSAVQYGSAQFGNIIINTPQTYTSPTLLGGMATVQFHHDYNVGDPSGPFGLGTLVANNGSNSQLTPTGGNRTIANPITMNTGFTVANLTGDTSSVTFTGPITFKSTADRLIQNVMPSAGGTLTLGSATGPSTFTLADTAGRTVTFAGSGKTVINDVIQDVPGIPTNIAVSNSSTTTFNGPQNTNGNFSVTGTATNTTAIINGTRSGSGTMTISATGSNAKLLVNGSKIGSGAVTVTAGTLGGTGSISGDVTNNSKIAPGAVAGTPGNLTLTGNVTNGANSHWLIDLSGAAADKLLIGGNLNLSAVDSLDISGAGTGSNWIIATYAGTLSGTFDNVTAGYTVNYGTGTNSQITLNAVAPGLPGDFNSDGKVDAGDYVTWRKNNGTNNALANDNGLGTPIGQSHYDLWRANFGNPPGAGSGSGSSGGSVPEPGTMALFIAGLVPLICPRRLLRSWHV